MVMSLSHRSNKIDIASVAETFGYQLPIGTSSRQIEPEGQLRRNLVSLSEVQANLDKHFGISSFGPDKPFSGLVPAIYGAAGIQIENYICPAFLRSFHGLMIDNGADVKKIFTVCFPCNEVIEKILARGEKDSLIITHHPLHMETGKRGFLPLPETLLKKMAEQRVSVYALHTPLDVHSEISTHLALVKQLGLSPIESIQIAGYGQAGTVAECVAPILFHDFLKLVANSLFVDELHFVKKHETTKRIAVVGGGGDIDIVDAAVAKNCDVLLVGTFYNQVDNEIGEQYRQALRDRLPSLEISLVEGSHYATEAIVHRTQLLEYCSQQFRVPCEFVPQSNPWD